MNKLKKCKICKLYKDRSSIGKDGVCQACKSNQQVADIQLPPVKCELFVQNISLTLLKSINNKYIAILDILKSSALATDLKNNLGKGVV